jgi:hypothetical protein
MDECDWIYSRKGMFMLCFFWNTSVVSARFLKGFLSQSKLAMLQTPIARGFWEAVHFMVIFLLVFANYAVGGRILFGAELAAWSTYARAASSSVQIMLGNFAFEEMYEVAPVTGTIWFWSFLVVIVFLLMNLLLVMVIDKVTDFRREIGHTPTIFNEAYHGLRDLGWRFGWRKEQLVDREFRMAISNPYEGMVDALMEESGLPESWQEASQLNCLEFRLMKRKMEDALLDGDLSTHKGSAYTNSLELRKMGCDAMTAEHLLEECQSHFENQEILKDQSAIHQVREFVKLLQRQKFSLEEHCSTVEGGLDEDQEALSACLDRLEDSVRSSLEGFTLLRHLGVDSLAPPLPGQTKSIKKMMQTTLGDTLGVNGNFLGMEDMPPPSLRQSALGNGGAGEDMPPGPPAVTDGADNNLSSTLSRQRPPALED